MGFKKFFGFYVQVLEKHKKELNEIVHLDLSIIKGINDSIRKGRNNEVEYTPQKVRLRIPKEYKPNHSIPRQISEDIFVTLEIKDDIIFTLQEDLIDDPFRKLNTSNIQLKCGTFTSSWHLDRHDDEGIPNSFHPLYHLTFGGEYMENLEVDETFIFGKSLILRSPRISHPPMEFVLLVDFILNHYFKTKDLDILQDPSYENIIKKFKHMFWKPYALAKVKYYCDTIDLDRNRLSFNSDFVKKVNGKYDIAL